MKKSQAKQIPQQSHPRTTRSAGAGGSEEQKKETPLPTPSSGGEGTTFTQFAGTPEIDVANLMCDGEGEETVGPVADAGRAADFSMRTWSDKNRAVEALSPRALHQIRRSILRKLSLRLNRFDGDWACS